MSKIIDADELNFVYAILPEDASEDYKEGYGDGMNYVLDIIDDLPTIDPVKHGRWEMGGGYLFPNWTCSRCKCIFCGTEEFPKKYKFCPQCGTRMYEE